jgi:hypothetical protein
MNPALVCDGLHQQQCLMVAQLQSMCKETCLLQSFVSCVSSHCEQINLPEGCWFKDIVSADVMTHKVP